MTTAKALLLAAWCRLCFWAVLALPIGWTRPLLPYAGLWDYRPRDVPALMWFKENDQ